MANTVVIVYDIDTGEVKAAKDDLDELNESTKKSTKSADVMSGAVSALGDSLSAMGGQVGQVSSLFTTLNANMSQATKGLGNVTTGFKALDKVLKASVIFLIIGALVSLALNLTKTAKGAAFLRNAMATLEGVFNGLVDVLLNVDKIFQRNLIDTMEKNIRISKNLAGIIRGVGINYRRLTREISELSEQYELANQMADDSTISLRKQQEEAQKAADLALEIAEREKKIADDRLTVLKAQALQRKAIGEAETEETRNALNEAEIAQREAATNITRIQLENATRLRQIDQDTFEQRRDFLLDFTDTNKAINERILADTSLPIEQRFKVLEETINFTNQAFNKSVKAFEEQAGQRLDVNMLLKESDADVVFNYLRGTDLSEVETQRFLELLRERNAEQRDLAEAEKDLNDEREKAATDRKKTETDAALAIKNAEFELKEFRKQQEINQANTIAERVQREIELAELRKDHLLENEELLAEERTLIEEQYYERLNEIELQAAEESAKITKAKADLEIKTALEVAQSLAGIFNRQSKVGKAFALLQIAADTGAALAGALRNSQSPTNDNVLTGGLAGIAKFAVIAGTIFDASRRAVAIVKEPEMPAFKDGVIDLQGPGTSTSDSIHARLSKGETVMTAAETKAFKPTFMRIRDGLADPDILNAAAHGNVQFVDNFKVVEVPQKQISIDRKGFLINTINGLSRTQVRRQRYAG